VLQGETCQDSLLSGEGRSLGAKISGGRGRPWRIFFGFYKTRHILLSDSANCIVLRAIVLTQYWSVTDGRTDAIAVASTALAMWCAVKMGHVQDTDHVPFKSGLSAYLCTKFDNSSFSRSRVMIEDLKI